MAGGWRPRKKGRDHGWWLGAGAVALGIVAEIAAAAGPTLGFLTKEHVEIAGAISIGLGVLTSNRGLLARWRGQLSRAQKASERERAASDKKWAELGQLVTWRGLVRDAKPLDLGVSISQFDDTTYVQRWRVMDRNREVSVDEQVAQALQQHDFVLLVGESASGKSRTAFEAARAHFGDHLVVVPAKDHVKNDTLDKLIVLLEELYTDRDWGKPRAILWLDDLNYYLFSGAITPDVVTRLTSAQGRFKILATMQSRYLSGPASPIPAAPKPRRSTRSRAATAVAEGASAAPSEEAQITEQIARVLRAARRIEVPARLETHGERAKARRLYGDLDWERIGLGVAHVAGPELMDRLEGDGLQHPRGVLIVHAAIDWRRSGVRRLPNRSELEQLSELYLPQYLAWPEDFEAGLAWAIQPLPGRDIQLLRSWSSPAGDTHYEPHDYVVAQRARQDESGAELFPVPAKTWSWIVATASLVPNETYEVGLAAWFADQTDLARRAWQKAAEATDPAIASLSLLAYAASLADPAEEIIAYDGLIERFGQAPEPAVREQVAMALVNKGISLGELQRSDEAILAYDEVIRRFAQAPEPVLREQVAKALVNKGVALSHLGRITEACATLQNALDLFELDERRFSQELVRNVREARAQLGCG